MRWRHLHLSLLTFLGMTASDIRAERPVPLDTQFIRDAVETRSFRLGRPGAFSVAPDGKSVFFLRSSPRTAKQALFEFDVASGKVQEILTGERLIQNGSEELTDAERARRERMRVSVGGLVSYQVSKSGTTLLVPFGGKLYQYDRSTGRSEALPIQGAPIDPQFSPDGQRIAYVRDHDVWVYDPARRKEYAVTKGGSELKEHGVAEFVAQEEMGRFRGFWWSPDGRHIVFQESDASGVEVWQVPDPLKPEKAPVPQFYPRPGRSNVVVRLGIVRATGGKPTWIDWDSQSHPYLTHVDWHEHGGLTVCVQSRNQRSMHLLRVDPKTGKSRVLLEETDPAWVNIDQEVPRWLDDGSGFLWTTERRGGWELELRNPSGQWVRTLVPKEMGYRAIKGVDSAAGEVWFTASTDPTETHVWTVKIEGGEPRQQWTKTGVSDVKIGGKPRLAIHTFTGVDQMPVSEVHRADGSSAGVLPSVAEEPGLSLKTEVVQVGAGQGFYARITRPRNFDSTHRYPVVVDIYGGPHANTVEKSMGGWLMAQWLADQGFIVVAMDNRGTPRRGRDWERAIAGQFGTVPVEDQVAALRALGQQYPAMDLKRVGITGWSFGGYMSALAVLRRPDVFHAAVAGAPVTDWLDYDTHYTERYLGVPGPGDTGYPANSLLDDAKGLRRPLMLIHGTADDNVFFRHSLRLADALTRAGKPFEFLPLAGFTHMIPEPAMVEQRWLRTVEFFRRTLRE